MNLLNIKQNLTKKFDKLIKNATNRAIPIAKKEAAKVMKQTSEKTVNQIIETVKIVSIAAAIFTSATGHSGSIEPITNTFDGVRDVYIAIDNLTINC